MYFDVSLVAFAIDKFFGEFKFIKHPVIFMGDFISFFEKRFYKDSIFRGGILTVSLLSIIFLLTFWINYLPWWLSGIIASTTIAGNMLHESIKKIIEAKDKRSELAMIVSRDTKDLSDSDVYKASIESYAENLSDGVVAPLFYLLIFGGCGAFVYKGINTLDSMVGYRNEKYENFGKVSARLDDIANYIPSRITSFLISLLFWSKKAYNNSCFYGKFHESPNGGYPISAMAEAIGVKLGGDTSYFGKIKKKAFFGSGRDEVLKEDVIHSLKLQKRFDLFVIASLSLVLLVT
ncbi:MAG: adenosylcobinamide-phosphate synthase CbiB [Campylobacterales bacterium]|nr:adenosylcobinamide-phosphate synthase CbiB [Campylobacterales bacterium]